MRLRHLPPLLLLLSLLIYLPACKPLSPDRSAAGLPQSLTVVDAAPQAAARCGGSALRVVHGLDYDHDGRLGPFERLGVEVLCVPPGGTPDLAGAPVVTRADPARHALPSPGGG